MYYVIEIELRTIGTLRILNEGIPFDKILDAQSFVDEIIKENSRDMLDYIDFKVIEKKEDDNYDYNLRFMV